MPELVATNISVYWICSASIAHAHSMHSMESPNTKRPTNLIWDSSRIKMQWTNMHISIYDVSWASILHFYALPHTKFISLVHSDRCHIWYVCHLNFVIERTIWSNDMLNKCSNNLMKKDSHFLLNVGNVHFYCPYFRWRGRIKWKKNLFKNWKWKAKQWPCIEEYCHLLF